MPLILKGAARGGIVNHNAGDLIVVWQVGNSVPAQASGYTTIRTSDLGSGSTYTASRTSYKVAQSSSESVSGISNLAAVWVFSGQHKANPIGSNNLNSIGWGQDVYHIWGISPLTKTDGSSIQIGMIIQGLFGMQFNLPPGWTDAVAGWRGPSMLITKNTPDGGGAWYLASSGHSYAYFTSANIEILADQPSGFFAMF